MRKINADEIIKHVREMCMQSCCVADEKLLAKIRDAKAKESNATAKEILSQLLENADIAASESIPLCQDTGLAVFFIELGNEILIDGMILEDAINEGVRQGYSDGYLRKSVVSDPLERKNTGDNTPAIIHLKTVLGDKLKIRYAAKGGGSENMSEVRMLKPADGVEGVKNFVIERVKKSGGNPCPPLVVGIGIGGDFEKSAILSKEALFRELGQQNENPFYAKLERELLESINELGVGPMGMGGDTTALAVHILAHPCHIASLPVAVNINCHSSRHAEVII